MALLPATGSDNPAANILDTATSADVSVTIQEQYQRMSFWMVFALDGAGTGQVTLEIVTSPDGTVYPTSAERTYKRGATANGTTDVTSEEIVVITRTCASPIKWAIENQGGDDITLANCTVYWRAGYA